MFQTLSHPQRVQDQQLLIDFDGNFFVVDPGQELVASKRIVERIESDTSGMYSYTDGYELILRDRDSGDLSAVEFNRDGSQRTGALALDTFDIQEREIALQRDLDNNGIVGLQLQNKLFPSNYQSDSASYSTGNDLCVYLAVDGSVILSRVELNIPDQYASGVTDAYGDGAPVYDLRSNNINLWSFRDSSKAPTLLFCAMLMATRCSLTTATSPYVRSRRCIPPILKIWLTSMTQVVGYDLYVKDDMTGDLTGYAFNVDGQLDANRTADPSALNETSPSPSTL